MRKLLALFLVICSFLVLSCSQPDKTQSLEATLQALQTSVAAQPAASESSSAADAVPPTATSAAQALPTPTTGLEDAASPSPEPTAAPNPFSASPNYRLVSQLGGGSWAVAIQGQVAYLGVGPRLYALDLSALPLQVLATSEILQGKVRGIELRYPYAFVATGFTGGLDVIDINDPARPQPVSSLKYPNGGCNNLRLEGNLAYLICYQGLWIVDISDPLAPVEVSQSDYQVTRNNQSFDASATQYSLDIQDGFVYVTDQNDGLHVADVSNPVAPAWVGQHIPTLEFQDKYGTGGYSDVRVAGKQAFIASNAGLLVLDVSDPAHPAEAGLFVTYYKQSNTGLELEDKRVYLVNDFDGIYILDISDPATPQKTGLIAHGVNSANELSLAFNGVRDLALNDGRLYLPDATFGLFVYDVSKPKKASVVTRFASPAPEQLDGLVLQNERAFLYGHRCGLRVIDIADPAIPREIGYDDRRLGQDWGQVMVDGRAVGSSVYITDLNAGFWVFNIASDGTPSRSGAITPMSLDTLEIAAHYAYLFLGLSGDNPPGSSVGSGSAGSSGVGSVTGGSPSTSSSGVYLSVVDVANPANLSIANQIEVPAAGVLAQENGFLYILGVGQPGVFSVLDLSDPANPVLVGQLPLAATVLGPSASDLVVRNGFAYYSSMGGPLSVIDVRNPAQPALVGEYAANYVLHLDADNEHLYLGPFGTVLDLSDPAHPDFPDYIMNINVDDLTVQGDYLYMTSHDDGLWIYQRIP